MERKLKREEADLKMYEVTEAMERSLAKRRAYMEELENKRIKKEMEAKFQKEKEAADKVKELKDKLLKDSQTYVEEVSDNEAELINNKN